MKKLILKISLIVLLAASIVGMGYIGVSYTKDAIICLQNSGVYPKELANKFILYSSISLISALLELVILISVLAKGLPYVFSSSLKEYHEKKEIIRAEQKQKKIDELEKKLNELKKDE